MSPPTRRAYLGIGSNLGDRAAHLQAAVDGLVATPGISVVAVSPVYETTPVGGPPQDDYLNAVVAVDTGLEARELMEAGQRLEAAAHRVRRERWGPRTLDVDVLLVGDEQIHDPDLEVPHPRLAEREFVLVPLSDLDARWAGARPVDPETDRAAADRATSDDASDEATSDQAVVRRVAIQLRVPE